MELNPTTEAVLLLQEQFIDSTSNELTSQLKSHFADQLPSTNQPADPPPHKSLLPLDRVGGGVSSQDPIGPRRRARRGPTPRTPQQQARSVARRNARERKRVRLVNLGFATLRDHIPPHFGSSAVANSSSKSKASSNRSSSNSNNSNSNSNNKKLSKVETLRCAIEYIKQLREAIGYDDKDSTGTASATDGFSSSSSPPEFLSSSPSSYSCTTPSPVMMLMSGSTSPPMFHEETDDFLDIMDWTTL